MKNNMKKVKTLFKDSNFLFRYHGDKYNINFYCFNEDALSNEYNKYEIDAQTQNNEYYVAIDEDVFNKALRDNDSALRELEKVLSFNRGIAGYFLYGLYFLFIVWFFSIYPSFITGNILYRLPFWLQMIGMSIIYVVLLGLPLLQLYRLRNSRVKTVWFATSMLTHLKDKAFRESIKNMKQDDNTPKIKWWNKRVLPNLISPFHNLGKKVIMMYSFVIVVIGGMIASMYIITDAPLNYLPTVYHEVMDYISFNTTIIKTRYDFTEKTDPITLEGSVESCGEYYCNYFSGFMLDNNLSEIDLNPYLNVDEEIRQIILHDDGVIVIDYGIIDSDDFNYKVIDLNNEEILYVIDNDFLGINAEFYYISDGVYSEGYLYLAGTEHQSETEKVGVIYKLSDTALVDTYYTEESSIIYEMIYSNDFLLTSEIYEENTDHTVLRKLNTELELIQKKLIKDTTFYDMYNVDGTIVVYDGGRMYNYAVVHNDLSLDFEYSRATDLFWIYHFNDRLIRGNTLKSYKEFDNDFNVLSDGLECDQCTDEEYFNDYFFVKKDNTVYAIADEYTLVFTETDTLRYSLSRSSSKAIYFIFYVALLLVPITVSHIVLKRREKEHKKVKKHLRSLDIK